MGLKVLITNHRWNDLTGAELYVRDLAMELQRQGHSPAVYTSSLGRIADELKALGIPAVKSPKAVDFKPDIIHGHHRYETLAAIRRFPDTPVLYVCHNADSWVDIPPLHSHILQYCGVSKLCLGRLSASGVSEEKITQILNFVDTERFKPRPPLPAKPGKALVFSNYATNSTSLGAIREACKRCGLELTVVGTGTGNPVERPEEVLGEYDIVFAKAKAAMEGMAVGAAVVLCDFGGTGPMVTSANFSDLRLLNFGFQALADAHTVDNLVSRIEQYDAPDAERVRDLMRSQGSLTQATAELVEMYERVITEYGSKRLIRGGIGDTLCFSIMPGYRLTYEARMLMERIPAESREKMRNHRIFHAIKRGFSSILGGRSA